MHEAPYVGDIGGIDPEHERSQLLGVLVFCHLEQMNTSLPQISHIFSGVGGLSRRHSDETSDGTTLAIAIIYGVEEVLSFPFNTVARLPFPMRPRPQFASPKIVGVGTGVQLAKEACARTR